MKNIINKWLVKIFMPVLFAGIFMQSECLFAQTIDSKLTKALVLYDPLDKNDKAPKDRIIEGDIEFVPGKVGLCAHFNANEKNKYNRIKYPMDIFPFDEGSLEMWVLFDMVPSTLEEQRVIFQYKAGLEAHTNQIKVFVGGKTGWGNNFFFNIWDGKEIVTQIVAPVSEWKEKEWHHIAMTWKLNAPGNSSIALYIDHNLIKEIKDLSIIQDKAIMSSLADDPEQGFFWLNYASYYGGGFSVDELRIYNVKYEY